MLLLCDIRICQHRVLDRYSQADQLCATFSQKCSDVAFCKRLRGQKGEVYAVQTDTLAVEDSELTARVVNEANAAEFVLTLTAYKDVIRLHINEDASKGRFQERQDPGHAVCQQYASLTWGGVLVKKIIGDHHRYCIAQRFQQSLFVLLPA